MKKLAAILLGTAVLAGLYGCGNEVADTSQTEEGKVVQKEQTDDNSSKEGRRYALFLASVPNETTMSIRDQAVETAKEQGIQVEVFIGNDEQATQVGQIETCITEGYDGLMIEPISSEGCIEVMKTAKEAGIAMVTVMQDCSDPSLVSAHVGADHEGAAALQMKEVCEELGGKGKVAIIDGVMGSTGQIQLTAGYESVLKDYPDIQVVEEQSGNWMIDEAMSVTETWLQKYNDLDAVIAQSDQMALGALRACKDLGVTLNISGRDAQTAALTEVAGGNLYGTVSQSAYQMGEMAVNVLNDVLDGKKVEDTYFTDNVFVTKDNISEYQ